jgi:hypothetical protein
MKLMHGTFGSLTTLTGLTALTLWLAPSTTAAPREYVVQEVRQIPFAQLSQNLRRAMRTEPRNPQWVHNLARAHAMVWALRTDSLSVRAGDGSWRYEAPETPEAASIRRRRSDSAARNANDVWFGYEPPLVPFNRVVSVADSKRLRVAAAHFDTAMSLYKQAVALDSADLIIRLGEAWLKSQTSDRHGAVERLRSIMRDVAKPRPPGRQYWFAGGRSVRLEAARYLVPLLDPANDRDEIASLERQIFEEVNAPRAVTPIAVPLRDGMSARSMEDLRASVLFDADGSGIRKRWTWIAPNAAWLVHDPSRSGRVTSALQLFGNVTFWMFWSNGYDALASLDDDHDGELRGAELTSLALWHDANGNGVSEAGEVRPVSAHDIVAFACRGIRDLQHPDRLLYAPTGVRYVDGTTRPTVDLVLHDAAPQLAGMGSRPAVSWVRRR